MELQRFLARMGMHIEDSRRKVSDDDFFFLLKDQYTTICSLTDKPKFDTKFSPYHSFSSFKHDHCEYDIWNDRLIFFFFFAKHHCIINWLI